MIGSGNGLLKILFGLTVIFTSMARADEPAYGLEVQRDGEKVRATAYNFWSGEYPGPVINVNAHLPGKTTTVKAYVSLRTKSDLVSCTIKNGLYHPWSRTKNSVINYYSITAESRATVRQSINLDGVAMPAGSRIENIHYQSEGYCGGNLFRPGSNRPEMLSVSCFDLEENPVRMIRPAKEFHEQWLYVRCADGKRVFIEDQELLEQTGEIYGEITDWGSVSP